MPRHFPLKYVSIPAEKCLAQRKNFSLPVTLGVFRYTLGKVSKLASVVHCNGLKDLGEVFAILVMELIHEVHDRLTGFSWDTERKVGFRILLQQRKDNRLFSGTLTDFCTTV